MPYFSKFPVLQYPVRDGSAFKFVFVTNLLRRVALNDDLKSSDGAFIEYSIKDGERPEHIAERVYGDPSYHWLVMMTNDIIDPYHGWYKSGQVMEDYIQKKYGSTSVFFANQQDGFLFNTNFNSGCTLWQNGLGYRVLDYSAPMCKFTVAGYGYTTGSGSTSFVELPAIDSVNYMNDSYATSGFPGTWGGFEFTVTRVEIDGESSIPQSARNEMKSVSSYWLKCVKTSAANGRVTVLDIRPNTFEQGNLYRVSSYVYSNDSGLSLLNWQSDNLALNNRVAVEKYDSSMRGKIARIKTDFYTQVVSGTNGNIMVLRSGTSNPVNTVFYITGVEVTKVNTADINIKRVEPSTNAVHHFEITRPSGVCSANERMTVDPLTKESSEYSLLGGVVGSTGNEYPSSTQGVSYVGSGVVAFGETFVGRYMGLCGSANNNYAVSNYLNEYRLNDEKRTIKILHPRYKRDALEQLESLLRV